MGINYASIEAKAKAYMDGAKGQERARTKLQEYMVTGKDRTKAGSYVMNHTRMRRIADEFVRAVQRLASAQALSSGSSFSDPSSVVELFQSMSISNPEKLDENTYKVTVNFTGDLSRRSLEPDRYGGIDNIVALFNNGYVAPGAEYVIGTWHGETTSGLPIRDGGRFMQAAQQHIESKYASRDVIVELNPVYE